MKRSIRIISLLLPLVLLPMMARMPAGAPPREPDARDGWSLPDSVGSYDVTIMSLIGEMTDLTRLMRPPALPFTARLASSRDPASDYAYWFANNDRGNFIRSDSIDGRIEYVMMESSRPGAILRIWSANPQGTLRIYIDGASTPEIEAPMADLLSGKVAPFTAPFSYVANAGYNLFFPIPFSRSCRVTVDRKDLFYCLAYREYPIGVSVEPFGAATLAAIESTATAARSRLQNPSAPAMGVSMTRHEEHVSASYLGVGRCLVKAPAGGGVIRELRISPLPGSSPSHDVRLAIRADTVLGVEGPLRAFFGGSAGSIPDTTLPVEIREDGTMVSRWPMPFRDSIAIELRCPGVFGARVSLIVERTPIDPDSIYYFHATWHSVHGAPTRPMSDWPLIELTGQGYYVGTLLSVANPINHWWGEGDEKISIDGRPFNEYWGTGTEDLFGGAWALTERFGRPYHSFVETGPRGVGLGSWNGFWTMSRWYILDPLYFREQLRQYLEIYHTAGMSPLSIGAMNFWYGRAGASEVQPIVSRDDVRMPDLPMVDTIAGAIEGESMSILYFAGTYVNIWPHPPAMDPGWSRAQYFRWLSAPGPASTRLQLGFKAPSDGQYRVLGYFASGPGFGRFDIEINEQVGVTGLDFAGADVERTGPIDLGVFTLNPIENVLTVRVPSYATYRDGLLFGLDAILLVPVVADVERPSDPEESLVTRLDERRFRISMVSAGRVSVEAVDPAGRPIPLLDPVKYGAGVHTIDLGEHSLPSGAYMVRFRIGDRVVSVPWTRVR